MFPVSRRTFAVGRLVLVSGVGFWVASYELSSLAPVWLRMAGLAALFSAALVFASRSTAELASDVITHFSPSRKGARLQLTVLAIVVLVALAVRLVFIDVEARYDEAFTFFNFAGQPLGTGMSLYPLPTIICCTPS